MMLQEYDTIRISDLFKNIFFEISWQRVNSKVPRFLAQRKRTYTMILLKKNIAILLV